MTTPHRTILEPTNPPADVKDRSRRVWTRRDLLKAAMRMYFAERFDMRPEPIDTFWLDLPPRVSITELAGLSRLSEFELRELVEYGALELPKAQEIHWTFSADCVLPLRKACQLRDDLALDTHDFALAVMFFDQISALETELCSLRAKVTQGQVARRM